MVFVLTCLIAQLANEEIRKVISFFFSEWEQMLSLAEIAIRWAVINPVLCESFSRAEDLEAISRHEASICRHRSSGEEEDFKQHILPAIQTTMEACMVA